MRLLIVDDHALNRDVLRLQLEAEGHRVLEASNGVEALEILDRESVDGVVSDILMPGIDGFQLCLEIRKRKHLARLPFIFLTGTFKSPQDREFARTIGVDQYLIKPSTPREILGALEQAQQKTRDRIAVSAARHDETYVLKQYNESLVRKLEEHKHELEKQNLELEAVLKNLQMAHDSKQESEQRFRAIFEHAGVGISMRPAHDRNLPWIQVNDHFCKLLGYTRDELLKLSTADITPADDHATAMGENERLLGGAIASYSREKQIVHKDGRRIWVLLTVASLPGPDGRPANMISTYQEITERKEAEERVNRLNRVYAVLSGINTLIVHVTDRQELFTGACRTAIEHGNFGMAWIGMFDPVTQDVTPVAWAGKGADEITRARSSARADTPGGRGAVGRAIRERRPIFNNDLAAHGFGGPRLKEVLGQGFRSQITLPLFENQAIVGTLTMYAREPDFFDAEELKLLTELAGDISFALANISRQQKFDKLSRIRAISSEINAAIVRTRGRHALLKEACRIASEHGKFGMVWIATIKHEKQELQPVAWTGFSEETAHAVNWASISSSKGTLGEAMQTRKPSVRNDIEAELTGGKLRHEALERGCHSSVCLPLMVDGRVTALLILFASERGFFDKDELALLDELASNISFALEHIEREEKFARLSRIEAVMGSISGLIVRVRDRDELFREACRIVVDEGGFRMSLIGIVDRSTAEIVPVASAGKDEGLLSSIKSILSSSENAPKTMVARAIREKKTVVSNDSQSDSRVVFPQKYADSGVHSMAILPLIVSDEAIGVLALYARETGFFDDEELKLLTELTGNIAFAIDHIAKQERLDYLAYYDALTGLANRTLFLERVTQAIRSAASGGHKLALFLIDLDRFKNINDSLGRAAGDALLRQVAAWMTRNLGDANLLARVDADHFAVVLPKVKQEGDVARLIEKSMNDFMAHPFQLRDAVFRIAAKVGVALYPDDGADADTLFRNAEAALKKAKSSGERYLFHTRTMTEAVATKLTLENQLRLALDNEEFVLHYQTKVNLASGAVCGLEALIRWQKPGADLVAPGVFIPLLEETGLILGVGKWALSKALAQHRDWAARGIAAPRIAVNVSAIQLQQKDFSDVVIGGLQEQDCDPDALELEVTESLLMQDVQESIRTLSILRGLGIFIAMDDFGTGYSSLAYIARLPITSIKIDRAFITGMAGSPQDMGIVTTIIALAHSMNLKVVAEGVETESQSKLLKLLKCDEAQGFLYGKPLPAAEIEAFLLNSAPENSRLPLASSVGRSPLEAEIGVPQKPARIPDLAVKPETII